MNLNIWVSVEERNSAESPKGNSKGNSITAIGVM